MDRLHPLCYCHNLLATQTHLQSSIPTRRNQTKTDSRLFLRTMTLMSGLQKQVGSLTFLVTH